MQGALDFAKTILADFFNYVTTYWQILVVLVVLHLFFTLRYFLKANSNEAKPLDISTALDYFVQQGYKVDKVIYQGRLGGEYLLTRLGARTCLHIKWWSKPIGSKPVEELAKAQRRYNCEFSILVSKEGAARAARRAAIEFGVWLWDANNLEKELESLAKWSGPEIMAVAATKQKGE